MIELIGVSFTYMPGTLLATRAVSDVDLRIREGEFVGLIGPTGSGKSTLIQLFNGLLLPAEGKVLFEGREIGREVAPSVVRKAIGLVFQFPESQLFDSTVAADIAFGPRNLGLSGEELESRVRRSMEMVGLEHGLFKDRSPFSLSGGEMRRAAIAGVLAMEPRMLVLDEPTSGLDLTGRSELLGHLRALHQKGMAVVLVTHDMDEAAQYVDRLVVLREGRVTVDDLPEKVFSQSTYLAEMGLAVPHVAEVLQKLRDRGVNVSTGIYDVEAAAAEIAGALAARGKG